MIIQNSSPALRSSSEELKRIFLYNDSTNPSLSKKNMDDYLNNVAILAKSVIS